MSIVLDIFVLSGSVLGLFMSISIAASNFFRSKANSYLSASLFLLTLLMLLGWLNATTGIIRMVHALMWELLVPVTLFSYFLIHLDHPFYRSKTYKLFYLPFLISVLIDLPLELDFSMGYYKLPFSKDDVLINIYFEIENWAALLLNLGLMFWARVLINKADTETRIKIWLRRLNSMLLTIIAVWFLQELIDIISGDTSSTLFIWASISFVVWLVLYFGVFKLQIVIEREEIHQLVSQLKKNHAEFRTQEPLETAATCGKQSEIAEMFITLVSSNEWYKNTLLSRQDIAAELGISEGYLSQIIKKEFNKSIVQIINDLRIAEAKRLLQNQSFNKYSIEAIGLESGFKSKSVFYSQFKASTDLSPGEFRKQFCTS